ncbi:hypothetical protein V1477_007876 [Vespula maculifrons]|uniref:Uncharacterized protein n=1 Tax=Vespula maculifrons TaxID=7453 RepID=A0ABD2CG27_VESMC
MKEDIFCRPVLFAFHDSSSFHPAHEEDEKDEEDEEDEEDEKDEEDEEDEEESLSLRTAYTLRIRKKEIEIAIEIDR